jgi:hypothetical protein
MFLRIDARSRSWRVQIGLERWRLESVNHAGRAIELKTLLEPHAGRFAFLRYIGPDSGRFFLRGVLGWSTEGEIPAPEPLPGEWAVKGIDTSESYSIVGG